MFNAGEMLGPTLTSIHNLRFYQRFMARMRELMEAGKLSKMIEEFPIASSTDLPQVPEEMP
jgi:queuine tRNA-ribosyltransferase